MKLQSSVLAFLLSAYATEANQKDDHPSLRKLTMISDPVTYEAKIPRERRSCSPKLQAALMTQMPPSRCPLYDLDRRFWCGSHCVETACPVASWLEEYYQSIESTAPFLGVSVGCNKAMDAVDTLRMGSRNPEFIKEKWLNAMFDESTSIEQKRGACNQGLEPPITLKENVPQRPAIMHCIEPVPSTVARLESAAASLGWDTESYGQKLVISPFAIGKDTDESGMYFPSAVENEGVETLSLESCSNPTNRESLGCQHVSVYSLDAYSDKYLPKEQVINVLNIDVEGFDFDVMQGGLRVLQRSEYLEFEYHMVGSWRKQSLRDAIDMLDSQGFTCYWAGREKLWRITGEGCFLDHYEHKCWSNVACVSRELAPQLSEMMERIFTETIQSRSFVLHSKVKGCTGWNQCISTN